MVRGPCEERPGRMPERRRNRLRTRLPGPLARVRIDQERAGGTGTAPRTLSVMTTVLLVSRSIRRPLGYPTVGRTNFRKERKPTPHFQSARVQRTREGARDKHQGCRQRQCGAIAGSSKHGR